MATQTGSYDFKAAKEASAQATKFLTELTNDGVYVHQEGEGPDDTQTPSGWHISNVLELLKNGVTYIKAWLNGVTPTVRLGQDTAGHADITPDGLDVYTNASDGVAHFGSDGARIGKADESHISIEQDGLNLIADGGKVFSIETDLGQHSYTSSMRFRNDSTSQRRTFSIGGTQVLILDETYRLPQGITAISFTGGTSSNQITNITTAKPVYVGLYTSYFTSHDQPSGKISGSNSYVETRNTSHISYGTVADTYTNFVKAQTVSFTVGTSQTVSWDAVCDLGGGYFRADVDCSLEYDADANTLELKAYARLLNSYDEPVEGIEADFIVGANLKANVTYTTHTPAMVFGIHGGDDTFGENSVSLGIHTVAQSDNQTVLGKYNAKDANGDYAAIVGNGTADNTRGNALAVKWDGTIDSGVSGIGAINWVDISKGHAGLYVPKDLTNSTTSNYAVGAVVLETAGGGAWMIANYNDEQLQFVYINGTNRSGNVNTTIKNAGFAGGDT